MSQVRQPPRLGDGRYSVVDVLGDGGTATVYLAWDAVERGWCAVKALQTRHLSDPEIRRRFSQEAEALERFKHPNIPRLIQFEADTSPPFLVIELARNGSTMDWVREYGPMPPSMAASVLLGVCEALALVHDNGVVHRDVKPHNFLIDDSGSCKLTDFGIARVPEHTSLTATGSQIGTFSFMAPEQRSDTKSVDARADVYSAGASLYTLLTARTSAELFVADSDDEILRDVPEAFRKLILKATRYKPDERFPDIRAFRQALIQAEEATPDPSTPFPPLVREVDPLLTSPPTSIPGNRRFPDLEQALALDGMNPTYVPASERMDVTELGPPKKVMPYFMPSRDSPGHQTRNSLVVPDYLDAAEKEREEAFVSLPPMAEPVVLPKSMHDDEGTASTSVAPSMTGSLRLVGPVVALVAGGVFVLLLGAIGGVTLGTWQVSNAHIDAAVAGTALTETLRVNGALVYDLQGDRSTYEALYLEFLDAKRDDARVEIAQRFVAALDTASQQGAVLQATEGQVRQLRSVRDAYRQAEGVWAGKANRFPGNLAVAIGLVPEPPAR